MSISKRRAALAALPVALGLLVAGPAVGTASAAPQAAEQSDQARCLLLCFGNYPYYHHHHHHHHGYPGYWLY